MTACRRPGDGEGAMAGQRSQADLSQGLQVQCSPSRALALGAAPVAGGREHAPLFSVQGPIFFSHQEGRKAMELLPTSLHVTVKWHRSKYFLFTYSLNIYVRVSFFSELFQGKLYTSLPFTLNTRVSPKNTNILLHDHSTLSTSVSLTLQQYFTIHFLTCQIMAVREFSLQ